MKNQYVLVGAAILVIVVVVGGWYSLTNPAVASALGFRHASMAQNHMASSTGARMMGGFTQGTIETLNGDGFTLTLQDSSTKNVLITATTTIENFTTASSSPATSTVDQLSVGEQVTVIGMPNDDGSITARRVLTGAVPQPGSFGRGGSRAGSMGSSTYHGGDPMNSSGNSAMPPAPAAP